MKIMKRQALGWEKLYAKEISDKGFVSRMNNGDFPGGAVGRTPHSQCRGSGFDPWSGN